MINFREVIVFFSRDELVMMDGGMDDYERLGGFNREWGCAAFRT